MNLPNLEEIKTYAEALAAARTLTAPGADSSDPSLWPADMLNGVLAPAMLVAARIGQDWGAVLEWLKNWHRRSFLEVQLRLDEFGEEEASLDWSNARKEILLQDKANPYVWFDGAGSLEQQLKIMSVHLIMLRILGGLGVEERLDLREETAIREDSPKDPRICRCGGAKDRCASTVLHGSN